MRITIEVEIDSSEVGLATELFRAMRAVTSRVETRNLKGMFSEQLRSLEEHGTIDSVASSITNLLVNVGNNSESAFQQFFEAFVEIVFAAPSDEMVPVVPYLMLLPSYVFSLC